MSRNEMFLLLACAIVAAIISGDPLSSSRQPTVSIANLLAPVPDVVAWNEPVHARHGIEQR